MRLIDADRLKDVMIETLEKIKQNPKMDNQEAHIISAFHTVGLMVDNAPTIEPLTERGYTELHDRYGDEVPFVVLDMIEQADRRWRDKGLSKMGDVVKVVRCKDCKWWGDLDPKNRYTDCYCHVVECSTEPDWYCADGEKDNE